MCREGLAILGLFAVVFAYPGLSIAGAPREIALPSDKPTRKASLPLEMARCTWAASPPVAYGASNLSRLP